MKKADYRESHTEKGKGKVYHESFVTYPYRKYMWEWEQSVLSEILRSKVNRDSPILDFACGTGRILNFLITISDKVTGVDVSDSMLEVSSGNHPDLELVKADLTKDNVFLGKRQFPLIITFRFFLNAQNSLRVEVLDALYPLLEDNGIFIFNNHGNATGIGTLLGKLVVSIKNIFRNSNSQFTYYLLSHSKIKTLLKDSGFEITETHHRSVFPILNEKTKFDVSKIDKIENWFSSKSFFRPFARSVIYVCKKKNP